MDEVRNFGSVTMVGKNEDMAKLYKKMTKVMNDVDKIPKNGWNDFHKYEYSTAEDIKGSIQGLLFKHGIFLSSSVEEVSTERFQANGKTFTNAEVKMRFGFHCVDTGATMFVVYTGNAMETGDKYLYKAYTGAMKYVMTNNLVLSSGDDDPEVGSPEEEIETDNDQNNQEAKPNLQPVENKETENLAPIGKIRNLYLEDKDGIIKVVYKYLKENNLEEDIKLVTKLDEKTHRKILDEYYGKDEEEKEEEKNETKAS